MASVCSEDSLTHPFLFSASAGQREDPAVMEARRREAARLAAFANAAAARRVLTLNTEHFMTTEELVDGMTPVDRKAFVKNFLQTEVRCVSLGDLCWPMCCFCVLKKF